MSEKIKLKFLLSLVCDRCNKAWSVIDKNHCEDCVLEQEYEGYGWNDLKNE